MTRISQNQSIVFPSAQRCVRTARGLESLLHGGAIVLVAAAFLVIVVGAAQQPERPEPASWTSVAVDSSGTLWEIARQHAVPGLSTSETVDLIKSENQLASSTLYSGQTLRVPAAAAPSSTVATRSNLNGFALNTTS